VIEALIVSIALEMGMPPYFVLAIAYTENPALDPLAISQNQDGTFDYGVMQLNSGWYKGDWRDPEINIRAGCEHIKWLLSRPNMNYWLAAIAYNCGYSRLLAGPPDVSIEYANQVFARWNIYRHHPCHEEKK
jgi:soluble lytic murein transglycosylase-like protein